MWRVGGRPEGNIGIVGRFIEVCARRGLEINTGKSKVMLLGEEEG